MGIGGNRVNKGISDFSRPQQHFPWGIRGQSQARWVVKSLRQVLVRPRGVSGGSRRHPNEMPKPPQLAPFHPKDQRLYSEVPHCTFKVAASQPSDKTISHHSDADIGIFFTPSWSSGCKLLRLDLKTKYQDLQLFWFACWDMDGKGWTGRQYIQASACLGVDLRFARCCGGQLFISPFHRQKNPMGVDAFLPSKAPGWRRICHVCFSLTLLDIASIKKKSH